MGKKGRFKAALHGPPKDPKRIQRMQERAPELIDPKQLHDYGKGSTAVSLLAEWARKEKLNRPNFSRARSPPDTYRMRVTITDQKGKIPTRQYMTHEAYPTLADAKQFCAVVALAGTQGEKQLHLLLPSPLAKYWFEVKERMAQAAVKEERRTEIHRKVQESQSRLERYIQSLPVVRMSESNRKACELAIRESRADSRLVLGAIDEHLVESIGGLSISGVEIGDDDDSDILVDSIPHDSRSIKQKLARNGFKDHHINTAIRACGIVSLEALLDWLVLNVPESELPDIVAPLKSLEFKSNDPRVSRLMKYGFQQVDAMDSLEKANDLKDFDIFEDSMFVSALYILSRDVLMPLQVTFDTDFAWMPGPSSDTCQGDETIDDEIMAMDAIYGDSFIKTGGCYTVNVQNGHLDFYPSKTYPSTLMVSFYRREGLSATMLLSLNHLLALRSQELAGSIAMFELVSFLETALVDLEQHPPVLKTPEVKPPVLPQSMAQQPRRHRAPRARSTPIHTPIAVEYTPDRKGLPIYQHRDTIIAAIQRAQVSLIKADTGAGKSTQVAQYLLESVSANIICTQPRRVAATSLAERVASERGTAVGQVVGYQIRGQSRCSRETRLVFCTTGVLLRRLQDDADLAGITHLIIDEVHERGLDADFLLALVKTLIMPRRPDLKVCLMSATIDAGDFVKYFTSTQVLEIPGRTFPVHCHYLEDFIPTNATHRALSRLPSADTVKYLSTHLHLPPLNMTVSLRDNIDTIAAAIGKDKSVVQSLIASVLHGGVMYDVIVHLLTTIPNRSVLVFLPGAAEILQLADMLHGLDVQVHVMHSSVPLEQQRLAFMPSTKKKVVLATNIAETSITIPDIDCVIDSGIVRELRSDAVCGMTRLVDRWVSISSSRQRVGRAGRTKPGDAYLLYTKHRYESLDMQQAPEMTRVPLDNLCLNILSLGIGSPQKFLAACLSPPKASDVNAVMDRLLEHGAVNHKGQLTPMGQFLARLPTGVVVGKCLVYSALFECSDPMLTIAAILSDRSPFSSSFEDREALDAVKQKFDGGQKSDDFAVLNAYEMWVSKCKEGRQVTRTFCKENFLSEVTLRQIALFRKELARSVEDLGFDLSHSKQDRQLLRACLCGGLYPNIARVRMPSTAFVDTISGSVSKDPHARQLRLLHRNGMLVWIHPSSVTFPVGSFETRLIAYHDMTETSKVWLRNCTMATAYSIMLFGGPIAVEHTRGICKIGGFVTLRASAREAVLFAELRKELDRVLTARLKDPSFVMASSPVVRCVYSLLESEMYS